MTLPAERYSTSDEWSLRSERCDARTITRGDIVPSPNPTFVGLSQICESSGRRLRVGCRREPVHRLPARLWSRGPWSRGPESKRGGGARDRQGQLHNTSVEPAPSGNGGASDP